MATPQPLTKPSGLPDKLLDFPLGVYFGLAEDAYHRDRGLGSSSMKRLSYDPPGYWWESWYNPQRPVEKDSEAKRRGRAVHSILLYGREDFERRFGAKQYNWATKAGFVEKDEFAKSGKIALSVDDYERTLTVEAIVRGNPHLAAALNGGVGREVSVFWMQYGIKRKARFDILKIRSIIDVKNISNERAISFPRACLRKIDEFAWHIQAAHYLEARAAMRPLVEDGQVFGATDAEKATLLKACGSREAAWVWLFIQADGAPLTHGLKLSYIESASDPETGEVTPELVNPIIETGRMRLRKAEQNYIHYVGQFGLGRPWLNLEPVVELAPEDLPPWFGREDPI